VLRLQRQAKWSTFHCSPCLPCVVHVLCARVLRMSTHDNFDIIYYSRHSSASWATPACPKHSRVPTTLRAFFFDAGFGRTPAYGLLARPAGSRPDMPSHAASPRHTHPALPAHLQPSPCTPRAVVLVTHNSPCPQRCPGNCACDAVMMASARGACRNPMKVKRRNQGRKPAGLRASLSRWREAHPADA